ECRELIQEEVLKAYQEEKISALKEGYICRYDDFGEEDFARLSPNAEESTEEFSSTPPVETQATESTQIRKNNQTFRIDSGAQSQESIQPHHSASDQSEAEKISANEHEPRSKGDTFGTGIV
ncbi:MAG: stage V sporulation protein G, partial [Gimesia sp.]|nr:stage V sporulation protein G [Gimesia sp.]